MNWSNKVGNAYVRMCLTESPSYTEVDLDAVISQLTPEEIANIDDPAARKKAYRRVVSRFHPDTSKAPAGHFEALQDLFKGTKPSETIRLRQRAKAQAEEAARRASTTGTQGTQGTRPQGASTTGTQGTQGTRPQGASTTGTQGTQGTRPPPRTKGTTPPPGSKPAETVRQATAGSVGRTITGGVQDLAGFVGGAMAYQEIVPDEIQQALTDIGIDVPETSVTEPFNVNANELGFLAAGEAAMKGVNNYMRYRAGANPYNWRNIGAGFINSAKSIPGGMIGSEVAGAGFNKAVKALGGPSEGEGFRSPIVDVPILGPIGIDTAVDVAGYMRGSQIATTPWKDLKTAFKAAMPKVAASKLFGKVLPVVGGVLQAKQELEKGPYSGGFADAATNVIASTAMPVALGTVLGGPAGTVASLPFAAAAGGVALGSELGRAQNTFDQSLVNRQNLLKTYGILLSQASNQQEKDELQKKIDQLQSEAQQTSVVPQITSQLNDLIFGNIARGVEGVKGYFTPFDLTPEQRKKEAQDAAKKRGFKTADEVDADQKSAIDALRRQAASNLLTPEQIAQANADEDHERLQRFSTDLDNMFKGDLDLENDEFFKNLESSMTPEGLDEISKAAGYSGRADPLLRNRRKEVREYIKGQLQQQEMEQQQEEPQAQNSQPKLRALRA